MELSQNSGKVGLPTKFQVQEFLWAMDEFSPAFPFSTLSSQDAELQGDQTTWDEDITSLSLITAVTFPPGAFPLSEPCLEILEKQRDTTPQG